MGDNGIMIRSYSNDNYQIMDDSSFAKLFMLWQSTEEYNSRFFDMSDDLNFDQNYITIRKEEKKTGSGA